jgi:hypothetical protein
VKGAAKLDLLVAAIGLGAAYWLWPAGALTQPESSMPLAEVLRVSGALLSGAVLGLGGVLKAIKDAR